MKRRLEQATNKNIALEKMMRRLERDCLQMDNSDGEFERENLEIILSQADIEEEKEEEGYKSEEIPIQEEEEKADL